MSFQDSFNPILKELMVGLGGKREESKNKANKNCEKSKIDINPSQAIVILGILLGALDITSLLIDKNQEIQILLSGSLKQKTQFEKVLDQIGEMPFDEVVKAFISRLE